MQTGRQTGFITQRFVFLQKVVSDLLIGSSTVALLAIGAYQVMQDNMSSGTFFMFFGYIGMLYPAILGVMSGTTHLSKITACIDRINEITEQNEHITKDEVSYLKTQDLMNVKGNIKFKNISFSYNIEQKLFDSLNFNIHQGEHVAITGPHGSGKSTLLQLLLRFIDQESGEIYIDNTNMQQIPREKVRDIFGIVFQELYLFNASIKENLRYANPEISMFEVIKACKITKSHDFIVKLPMGYNSIIGQEGVELSRGQK